MKILVAMDSFKGSLDADAVCGAVCRGLTAGQGVEAVARPLADGGEGTAALLTEAVGGRRVSVPTVDAVGRPMTGFFGQSDTVAFLDTATASGLALLEPPLRDPLRTTSYGTGLLLRAALEAGCRRLVVGFGGSATNDGGVGALSALGLRFFDAGNALIERPAGGDLERVATVDASDLHPAAREAEWILATDVTNPLCGENGAAAVYAPQKGADAAAVKRLDAGLTNIAAAYEKAFGRRVADCAGAGAAGGLAAGLMAVFENTEICSGFSVLRRFTGLDALIAASDLVITGEGRTDGQTLFGKLPLRVAELAHSLHKPVVLLSGSVTKEGAAITGRGVCAVYQLQTGRRSANYCIKNAGRLLTEAAARIADDLPALLKE